jgi:hypothetical protein
VLKQSKGEHFVERSAVDENAIFETLVKLSWEAIRQRHVFYLLYGEANRFLSVFHLFVLVEDFVL